MPSRSTNSCKNFTPTAQTMQTTTKMYHNSQTARPSSSLRNAQKLPSASSTCPISGRNSSITNRITLTTGTVRPKRLLTKDQIISARIKILSTTPHCLQTRSLRSYSRRGVKRLTNRWRLTVAGRSTLMRLLGSTTTGPKSSKNRRSIDQPTFRLSSIPLMVLTTTQT